MIDGSELPHAVGYPIKEFSLAAVIDDEMEPIPFQIDEYNEALPPLKEFILPGGSQAAATCHLARAVCRRAERSVISVSKSDSINRFSQVYLNRLSDLLFVFARVMARQAGGREIYWQKDRV